jgi:Polysaccharide pyruvyl transferase
MTGEPEVTTGLTVGVVTFHRCVNNGSYWQARCLIDGLRARGHDAVVLDHGSCRVNAAEWKCALQPTLPTPVPRADRRIYRSKVHTFSQLIDRLPRSPPFDLYDAASVGAYDTIVVGSDEVWNLHHPWYGGAPLFFGVGLQARRLVAYAASFGNYDALEGLAPIWAEQLRRFDAISVRDENSRDLVAAAIGRAPEIALDPCLLFPPALEGSWSGPPGPFIAVYGHNFSPSFVDQARRTAKDRGAQTVSVSYRNDWADVQWLDAGPHEFAHAMARADAVVTDFFHGCVFALLNRSRSCARPPRIGARRCVVFWRLSAPSTT